MSDGTRALALELALRKAPAHGAEIAVADAEKFHAFLSPNGTTFELFVHKLKAMRDGVASVLAERQKQPGAFPSNTHTEGYLCALDVVLAMAQSPDTP